MLKIYNLGCKLNQYEGYCLAKKLSEETDVVIVNTCCVTAEAERKSVKKFRSACKRYPQATIIATGCDCQLHRERYSQADQIMTTDERNPLIRDIQPDPPMARYFLKIQDGCTGACSYCIVSKIRRHPISRSFRSIAAEIDQAYDRGYKEIVLVGANIGLYGYEQGRKLLDLFVFLQSLTTIPRIRLSSLEPSFINDELLRCLKDLPVCRHFHIPFQSADDGVLKDMKRQYTVRTLQSIIDMITKHYSNVALGGDVIVGFPSEKEENFKNTFHFIRDNPITHIHVFPYSPRPGTEAYDLGDPITLKDKKKRLWLIKEEVSGHFYVFRKNMIGKIVHIIPERDGSRISGLTDNYVRIEVDRDVPCDTCLPVKITQVTREKTFGVVVTRKE